MPNTPQPQQSAQPQPPRPAPQVQPPVMPQAMPPARTAPALARPAAPTPPTTDQGAPNPGLTGNFFDRFKNAKPAALANTNATSRGQLLVIAFLIFFVLMSALAVYRVKQTEAALSQKIAMQTAGTNGKSTSERIGMAVRWIDTAIALRGTAGQTVANVARGPGVTQVAMSDASGKIIASKNGNGSAFRTVSLKNFPQSGIRLTAVISDAGVANPVIARAVGNRFVLTMLAPGSLIGVDNMQGRTALVDRGSNVIDGSGTIARDGIADAFSLKGKQINGLMATGGTTAESAGGLQVTVAGVPNTDLKLFSASSAHLQGEFDMEVRVAHLPLVLQCRGQTSHRAGPNADMVIVGVALDVTEQRGAQSRLQLAEARLYDALNSMTDSFVVWDKLGRLILWNGKFEDFFGFKPGQLQKGLENHIVEHHGNGAIEEVYESQDAEGQIEIKLKDGRWVRYTEAPTADGGQVSIGTDITEIRARENDLRENDIALRNTVDVLKKSQTRIMELAENYEQEKIRAEDANQSKSDFLANMSHELRTPLNAINGFSDIMKKEMFGPLGDPRYKEYVSDILFSGQHLLSLINDILDMSKIEAGKMTLNTDLLQINDMIAQVVRIVRGRAEDGRLKLIYDNTETREIEADPRAVKQVLLNLATNAIKFTPEGGTVRIEAIEKQTGIIVKVHDSGIGISKENIERLAKPFEQIESKHSTQHEGTGLGLALSKSPSPKTHDSAA